MEVNMEYRIEKDTMGELKVDASKKWGAQTQRSLENFQIGSEKIPLEVIRSLVILKRSAALVNRDKGLVSEEISQAIVYACDEILAGKYDDQFPLAVWQTGSGTQTNMNVNEVIAHLANEKLEKDMVHPNDHVNRSQSSNDVFPSAMHMAAYDLLDKELLPALDYMIENLKILEKNNDHIIKNGRTHLQDATPLKLSQEIGAWRYSLEANKKAIELNMQALLEIPIGGTAVGTGLNSPLGFDREIVEKIKDYTSYDYRPSANKFHGLTSKSELVNSHSAMKALAMDLLKVANDIRWLASGPRSGIGELIIPANEPGSSIMPGKVNPTQAEAITMVCSQVLGNDTTISFGASQGNFQLNVYMPVIIYNFINSLVLLRDSMYSFTDNLVKGIVANEPVIKEKLDNSLMLVTALTPKIGYEKAAKIAKNAYEKDISLEESALELKYLTKKEYEELVDPSKMV